MSDLQEAETVKTKEELPLQKEDGVKERKMRIIINPNGTLTEVNKSDNTILVNRGNRIK